MTDHDVTFESMGSQVRLIVDDARRALAAQRWLESFDARLSRFRADSELCALNADPRDAVPASPLLRAAVAAGVWAAQRTGGLVDPTLVRELEEAGYGSSLANDGSLANLADALASAPIRRAASPSPTGEWREIEIDDRDGLIHRPPGVRIDSGGTGKGLAADALAHLLAGSGQAVIDCGGDVRVLGTAAIEIEIEHPLTRRTLHAFEIRDGAVATSGIGRRIWRTNGGGFAHHLIDPSTGRPAWTGLIQATALAPTALEAETLAKAALLSGPRAGPRLLEPTGGALVHDDGSVELLGALVGCTEAAAA